MSDGDYVSVQQGFWKSLWLVLRGARVRQWEFWDRVSVESLLDDDDYAVMAMEDE